VEGKNEGADLADPNATKRKKGEEGRVELYISGDRSLAPSRNGWLVVQKDKVNCGCDVTPLIHSP